MKRSFPVPRPRQAGLTLMELLLAVVIVAILTVAATSTWSWVRLRAGIHTAVGNLRHLVAANHAYAADHDGWFCPAQDPDNLVRWHGARTSMKEEFVPSKGFLGPYMSGDKAMQTCPLLTRLVSDTSSFEKGAGGYGYNSAYIGGQAGDPFQPAGLVNIDTLGTTVMFATTALAKKEGLQEYPFVEPYYWLMPDSQIGGDLQPSLHFRAGGKAIVAWADGRVSLVKPDERWRPTNFYGGNNRKNMVGFFGPDEENGYWNPKSPAARGVRLPGEKPASEEAEDQ